VILPKAYKQETEFAAEVAAVEQRLLPEVVHIRFYLEDDATGDPGVLFLILLADEASRPLVLRKNTSRIRQEITETIQPLWKWEVFPYFHFRSESEQAQLKSPGMAVADYNTSFEWARIDVLDLIEAVSDAFESWEMVREDPRAQRYLVC
jgi:hypothetical protein